MAIVTDRAGVATLDKPLTSENRSNAGTPLASVTPQYAGEIILDTTNGKLYQAQTLLNSGWVEGIRVV